MKMKLKHRSHRYDISRCRSRHGHKYSKYKKCFSITMLTCINQQAINIWSSIHEKVKQHWDWVEKSVAYKRACIFRSSRPQMFFKINVFKNSAIFTGKHLCWSLFLIKLQAQACNFTNQGLQRRCFPANIAKVWRTAFL